MKPVRIRRRSSKMIGQYGTAVNTRTIQATTMRMVVMRFGATEATIDTANVGHMSH